jgi:predicted metalloprotease
MFRRLTRIAVLGLAVVILAAVAALARPAGAGAQTARQTIDWTDPVQTINAFVPSINDYWRRVFVNYHRTYAAPSSFVWYGYTNANGARVTADCGGELPDLNAVYCQSDHVIYLGYDYLAQKIADYGAYAAVTTLAHEWGHHIQGQLGWWSYAVRHHYFMGTELQADCYAGMYTRWAYDHGWITAGNVKDAEKSRYAVGDDILNPGQALDPYAEGTHGTAQMRLDWFDYGFKTQNLVSCNSVYRVVYGS